MKNTKKLYIAYGSNLHIEQMARRCPTAKMIGAATLEDWQMFFATHATIEQKLGKSVACGIWEIDAQAEIALDRYEGYPRYYRKEEIDIQVGKEMRRAMVYIMNEPRPAMPHQGYVDTIYDGYADFGLDHRYLEDAMKETAKRLTK